MDRMLVVYLCFFYCGIGVDVVVGDMSKVWTTGEVKEGGDLTPAQYVKWREDVIKYTNQLRQGYNVGPITLELSLCPMSQEWATNLTKRMGSDHGGSAHSGYGTECVNGADGEDVSPYYDVDVFHDEIKRVNLMYGNNTLVDAGKGITGHFFHTIERNIASVCPSFSSSKKDRRTYSVFLYGNNKLDNTNLIKLTPKALGAKVKGITCYYCDKNPSRNGECSNPSDKYIIWCGGRATACRTLVSYAAFGREMRLERSCDYEGLSKGKMGCRPYGLDDEEYSYWNTNATECFCDTNGCNNKVYSGPILNLNSYYKSLGGISCNLCVGVGVAKKNKTNACVTERNMYLGNCLPHVKACRFRKGYDQDNDLKVWRECDDNNLSKGFLGCRPFASDDDGWNYWNHDGTECFCNQPGCNNEVFSGLSLNQDNYYKSIGALSCSLCTGEAIKGKIDQCVMAPYERSRFCLPGVKACRLLTAYDRDNVFKVWRQCDKYNLGKGFLGCRPVVDAGFNNLHHNATECFCNQPECNNKVFKEQQMNSR